MYNNDQIQEMIQTVNRNKEAFKLFLNAINATDRMAIMHVLSEGYYEAFDRYDSDVCEQFIAAYEQWRDEK